MSGFSKASRRSGPAAALALVLTLVLVACLQGPWDYVPENPPLFRGLWTQAYLVADKPITQFCFGRLISLDEEQTPAFAFYDSAEVAVAGRFSDGAKTLLLKPKALRPNCFEGDTASRPLKGETYDLQARFVWDSAGTPNVTRLSATATMTDRFAVKDTAVAPSVAFIGGFGEGLSVFSPKNFEKLPSEVVSQMQREFPAEVEELVTIRNDTAKLRIFFLGDKATGEKAKGAPLTARLLELLREDQQAFTSQDTLYYISNADLNTLSHTFTTVRGRGVKGVLITQRWEKNASRVVNPFQTFLGQKPESTSFYFPGDLHRLVFYPDADNVSRGFNVLDSMGVVNTWYFTGRNRLYFYACDTNYAAYLTTNTNAGESPEDNPKVVPFGNVRGGRGFFAALAVDSFDVHIQADPADQPYALAETHAVQCAEDGWFKSRDCIDYYREWCAAKAWAPKTCGVDAIRACLEVGWSNDTLGGLCDSVARRAQADSLTFFAGTLYYCIENNYPETSGDCAKMREECETRPGRNDFKEVLWDYCDVRDWSLPACRNAQVTYCREAGVKVPALCRSAEKICQQSPKPSSCP